MVYVAYPPPIDLAPWVECAWSLEGTLPPAGQMVLPDGRRELIFHLGYPPVSREGLQPATLITGSATEAIDLSSTTPLSVLGVRLRPEASGSILEDPSSEEPVPMHSLPGHWSSCTMERAGNSGTRNGQLAVLWDQLRGLFEQADAPDRLVAHSVSLIERARGRGHVNRFIPGGVGERQWQRRFLRACGYSPKTFARITRFQNLIALYESGPRRPFAELALEAGFFDQAHLANEFRGFCGRSPESFFHSGCGMSEFYRDGFLQDTANRR